MTPIYMVIEIRPDGTETQLPLGTFLKNGTQTTYTVNGHIAFSTKTKMESEHPENTYRVDRDWV